MQFHRGRAKGTSTNIAGNRSTQLLARLEKPHSVSEANRSRVRPGSSRLSPRHFLVPSNTLKPKSINECMPMIGARFYAHIDNLHVRGDILENELAKVSGTMLVRRVAMRCSLSQELDCGRLFRLICKLNTVLERPEYVSFISNGPVHEHHIARLDIR